MEKQDLLDNRIKYILSLDMNELLDLYSASIRCNNYCPVECKHFNNFSYRFQPEEVRAVILSKGLPNE